MKNVISVVVFFLVMGFSAVGFSAQGKVTGGNSFETPGWFKDSFLDIQEDVAEAKEEGKKIMLFFHLNNCPYCKAMLDENFFKGSNKKTIQDNFSVIQINIKGDRQISLNKNDEISEQQLATQLKVLYTPTVLFMDQNGKVIFRMNGYRDPTAFANLLDYVITDNYQKMSLSLYTQNKHQKNKKSYKFLKHSAFKTKYDLKGYKKPVAIMFEDKDCTGCADFHQSILSNKEVAKEMNALLYIRLDAYSDKKINWFDGTKISPQDLVNKYKLSYRPGVILFDEGKEVSRVDGKLYSYHFKEALRYISGRYYQKYATYHTYLKDRSAEILKQGINIDLSK
ncbi:MAG: hypothetical protein DRQ51_05600 [Gammaproteobacteria bacterium]|nr:MAG: hypothetical protein DRQ51_05600 [Gammaproteobacteria bacterium]